MRNLAGIWSATGDKMKHVMRFITGLVIVPFMIILGVLLLAIGIVLGPPIAILLAIFSGIYNVGKEIYG